MKNLSIRTRLLATIVIVNLLGAVITMVYLHQSFSGGLATNSGEVTAVAGGAWEDITTNSGKKLSAEEMLADGASYVERMKKVTKADYGLLLSKDALDAKAYEKSRADQNLPNNWDERDTYVLAAATDAALGDKMQLKAEADTIPEMGKFVGIENGACAKTCHGALKSQGDFWGVAWSTTSKSTAHSVLPVLDSAGKPIGVLYSIKDITAAADADKSSLVNTLLVIGASLILATLIIGGMLDALVLKRIKKVTRDMEDMTMRVAGGAFDAHFTPDGSTDEIGDFENVFSQFVDLVLASIRQFMDKSA